MLLLLLNGCASVSQTTSLDQLLADPALHGAYFAALATFVCDGLARCGYPLCSGGVMATHPRWRQPRRVWQGYFDGWITQPTPEGLLHSNIFFDLDGVHGRTEWADALRRHVARQARQHPRFLASMARNALLRTPPLGFFKDFVLEADGRHSAAINLKRRGTAPLTDLIRVYALAVGSQSLNSFDRLNDVVRAQALPPGRGPDLHDALEFIAAVRLRNQADDLKAGRSASGDAVRRYSIDTHHFRFAQPVFGDDNKPIASMLFTISRCWRLLRARGLRTVIREIGIISMVWGRVTVIRQPPQC